MPLIDQLEELRKIHNATIGLDFGVKLMIPIIGLIVIYCISSTATRILRQAGYKIGFIGADMQQFDEG